MERDKIKNIRYFEEYINKKEESNCRIKSWFINEEINPDRREIMLEKIIIGKTKCPKNLTRQR